MEFKFRKMWITVCLIFFVQLMTFVESAGPRIQPFFFPGDVVKGQSVTVTCAVAEEGPAGTFSFRWSRGEAPLSDRPLTRIRTAEEFSLLQLRSVDAGRGGNYTCEVTSNGGTANHTAELVVYELPEWNVVPEDAEVVFGSDLRIDCSATGVPEPTLTWTRESTDGGRHRTLSNGSLVLADVGAEDGGEYVCVANNGIGGGLKKTVTVIVHVPPQFRETFHLLKARSGHSAVLRCDVTGDAPMKVKWTKEYMDSTDSRYKVQETPLPNGLLSELYISRVLRKDAGLYVCTASNAYGRTDSTTKLVVLEPPASPSEVTIRDVDRMQATVVWNTPYGGNSPITRYVLQFWRDTGSTPRLEEAVVKGADRTTHALSGLRAGTSYVVRVIADNEFGSSAPSVPVKFHTEEDVPSGYPTDLAVFSSSLKELTVRWKSPAPDQRNGAIQGYELGFREHRSSGPYAYREAPMGPGALQQLGLGGLREDTEYEIVVRAYNSAGKGPLSMPVVGRTREKGLLSAPVLWVESAAATSVSLRWSGNEHFTNGETGHSVHFRQEGGKKWEERTAGQAANSFLLTDLVENTLYHIYVRAVSREGEQSEPSATVSVRTSDPSFERSSMVQSQESAASSSHHTTLVICLSVVTACVVIVCVVAGACVYVTRVTARSAFKRDGHTLSDFAEQHSTSRSTPLSRHPSNFRYVDVNSRPLLWCSTPAPPPHNDYPSPYATLPLRPTPIHKRWQSEDGMSPALSERSESLVNQRVEIPEDKLSTHRE